MRHQLNSVTLEFTINWYVGEVNHLWKCGLLVPHNSSETDDYYSRDITMITHLIRLGSPRREALPTK